MLILNKSSDDKGFQLETITGTILGILGYQNIVKNRIGAGGSEVDVVADYPIPMPGNTSAVRLLCECKAHRSPITMDDWHKFLGKIMLERTSTNVQVTGCLIALTGANGNVSGSYEQYKNGLNGVTLLGEAGIVKMLETAYAIAPIQQISDTVRKYTGRAVREIELAYYDKTCYWILVFVESRYSILSASGSMLSDAELSAVKPLVETEMAVHSHVDLPQELEAQRRLLIAEKLIIAHLFEGGGRLSKSSCSSNTGLPDSELSEAIRSLTSRDFVCEKDNELVLCLEEAENRVQLAAAIFRFWLVGEMPKTGIGRFIGCSYYDNLVDEGLLKECLRLQGEVPLSDERIKEAVKLIRLSPKALATLLSPQQMFVQHRVVNPAKNEDIDKHDALMFLSVLYRYLADDFQNPHLAGYFYVTRGFREIECVQRFIVKNNKEVELEYDTQDRTLIGIFAGEHLAPNYPDFFILMKAIHGANEPWETSEPDNESVQQVYASWKQGDTPSFA